MGRTIKEQIPFTENRAKKTRELAFKEAERRQKLADRGFFNTPVRTCDIEQEIQVMDKNSGLPLSAQRFNDDSKLGTRLDTTVFNIEYDGNGITSVSPDEILALYRSLLTRTKNIQFELKKFNGSAILVPVGLQPIITDKKGKKLLIRDKIQKRRFNILDEITGKENPVEYIRVSNPFNGKYITGKASNLFAMARCSGTQIHISDTTVENAISTHNILIALTPMMIALFGNSVFTEAKDMGRVSTRIEFLRQAEQLRAGLSSPVKSLFEFYANQLNRALPPFIVLDNPVEALDLNCGAIHTTSRIQIDLANGTIRNEIRQIDSQSPFRTISALLFTLGCIEALRNSRLPSFNESKSNFVASVFGLSAKAIIFGKQTTLQEIAIDLMEKAATALEKIGMTTLVKIFLLPLRNEIIKRETQGIKIRMKATDLITKGLSSREAIIRIMNEMNQEAIAREYL